MSTLRITQEVRCTVCGTKLKVTSGGGLSADECENYRCCLCYANKHPAADQEPALDSIGGQLGMGSSRKFNLEGL